jgi:D-glycero-D-manno-heptose 1,7-bisphosphate phosphatase
MNKAIFVSLNSNTLVKTKSGNDYPQNEDDWEFVTGILPKIKKAYNEGYIVCLVSNEGGIQAGHTTMEQVKNRINAIQKELETYLRCSVNVAFCGYLDSYYKKPKPGMAYQLALELELALGESIMVGNSNNDSKFAKYAHIGTYYDIDGFLKYYN